MIPFAIYDCKYCSKGSGDALPTWSSRWRPVGGSQALQHYKQKQLVKKEKKQQPSFHVASAVSPEVDRPRLLSGIEVALIRGNASRWTVSEWHLNNSYTKPLITDAVELACPAEEGFYSSGAIRCSAVCQKYYLLLLSEFIFHFQISYLHLARLCTH